MKNLNITVVFSLVFILLFASSCEDKYENHALAIRNKTENIITFERFSGSNLIQTIEISPNSYIKFFETSTDLWLTPPIELNKISDSLRITYENIVIRFSPNNAVHYNENPYSSFANWITEIDECDVPKLFGNKKDRVYIHIFEIEQHKISD
jgi:hypothetical protein